MSDDIVTRLRNWHDQRDSWQTLTEAADEIERLRAELHNAIKLAVVYCQEAGRERTWDDAADLVHDILKGWNNA